MYLHSLALLRVFLVERDLKFATKFGAVQVQADPDELKPSKGIHRPQPVPHAILGILKSTSSAKMVLLRACQLSWALAVHAAARVALVECSAVTAIWATLVRIAGEPNTTISGNTASQTLQCTTETVDASTHVPEIEKAQHSPRWKQAGDVTVEQKLVECCLGALSIFMIDKRARQQLLAAQKKHAYFLSLLFELASSDIWPNIWKVTAYATDQDESQISEAVQSQSGAFTDAAQNQDPGDALCGTDGVVQSCKPDETDQPMEAETAVDLDEHTLPHTTPNVAEDSEFDVREDHTAGLKVSQDCGEHGHDVNNHSCIGKATPDLAARMNARQSMDLRISRLAAGVITALLSRDANARRACLERHGSLGIYKLLGSSSACIQMHGMTCLGALGADDTHEQLVTFDSAIKGDLIVLLCSMLRRWTSQQLAGVDIIEEPECSTPVLHGLELVQAALLTAVEAKLAHSDPDAVFVVLAEVMHLGYWCMGQGKTANRTLMVCLGNSAGVQFW